jgi:multidrug resistance protein, MATE family
MSEPVVTRPRLTQLLLLAWPNVGSRAAQVVVGVSDTYMVAPLGEDALAAATAAAFNSFAFFALPIGTVFIVGSFAAQLTGKGDHGGARRYAWYGLVVALAAELMALTPSGASCRSTCSGGCSPRAPPSGWRRWAATTAR